MEQKGINLRDLNEGAHVKLRKSGGGSTGRGLLLALYGPNGMLKSLWRLGWTKLSSLKRTWVLDGAVPKPASVQMPEIFSMADAAAMNGEDIPEDTQSDDGSKASSSTAQSKMSDR